MELQTNSIHMLICIDTRRQRTDGAGSSLPKGNLLTSMQPPVLATGPTVCCSFIACLMQYSTAGIAAVQQQLYKLCTLF